MHALQRSTQYDGYAKTDLTIRWALYTSGTEVAGENERECDSLICLT